MGFEARVVFWYCLPPELCMVDKGFGGRQYQKTTLASNPKRDYPWCTGGNLRVTLSGSICSWPFLELLNFSLCSCYTWTYILFVKYYHLVSFLQSKLNLPASLQKVYWLYCNLLLLFFFYPWSRDTNIWRFGMSLGYGGLKISQVIKLIKLFNVIYITQK